jgi:ribonuclease P protein component
MVSDFGCGRVPAVPPSRRVGTRAGSVSLPEYESLRNPQDFRRVLEVGDRKRSGAILVVSAEGRPGPPRVGLVVSKRSGGAVTRNRIKRRIRHLIAGKQLQPGVDYVIIASREVAETTHPRLEKWLVDALGGS